MALTYTPIATTTASGSAATYTFSSISGTYTDLILVCNVGITTGTDDVKLQFNSDTGTNYSYTILRGTGSAAGSTRATNFTYINCSGATAATTSIQYDIIANIQNYSNTSTYKSALVRSSNAANGTDAIVGLWRSTSAITSVTIYSATNFASGSMFTLYGVKAA